jgi:hypothetical protein
MDYEITMLFFGKARRPSFSPSISLERVTTKSFYLALENEGSC